MTLPPVKPFHGGGAVLILSLALGLAACEDDATGRKDGDPQAAANRLHEVAASGRGDPRSEALQAMDRGDFRFVGYLFMVPGGWPAAYGVQCHPAVASQRALVGATWAASDVPDNARRERPREENFRRFGAAYNAVLLADPRFPHKDSCEAVPVGDSREREIPAADRADH